MGNGMSLGDIEREFGKVLAWTIIYLLERGIEVIKRKRKTMGILTLKKPERPKKECIVVIEVGRAIIKDVIAQFGEENIIEVIGALRTIKPEEFLTFAREFSQEIARINREYRCKKINLILSGPVGMNFLLGQSVGLLYPIQVWQWQEGEYIGIPKLTRDELMKPE